MKDVTNLLNKYRECSRNLWNAYFLCDSVQSIYDRREIFDGVDRSLFSGLVLAELGKRVQEDGMGTEPFLFLRVIPNEHTTVPIMINRPSSDNNRYWDEPVNQVESSEVDLRFVGYFDWNRYDYVNFQYYLTRIVSFPKYPHLAGREALLETAYAKVFFAD